MSILNFKRKLRTAVCDELIETRLRIIKIVDNVIEEFKREDKSIVRGNEDEFIEKLLETVYENFDGDLFFDFQDLGIELMLLIEEDLYLSSFDITTIILENSIFSKE